MSPRRRFSSAVLAFVFLLSGAALAADRVPRPLTQREVVALVAARVLPESIAANVATNGLNFQPSAQYLARLKAIGSTEVVVDALRRAKTIENTEETADESLARLFRAGEKGSRNDILAAAREIAGSDGNFESDPELAFVMADLFARVEQFDKAALVYSQIAAVDPEFPEIHAKLAYVLYRAGESERATSEARAALARTPKDPEAQRVLDEIDSDYAAATGSDSNPRSR
jgi:tetratricopeptide (TPR) repeat protein